MLQGPLTDSATVTRIREKLLEQKPFYEEILNYRKNGESYWISLAVNPVFNDTGALYKFVSVQALIDDTKREQLEFNYKLDAISRSQAVIEFSPDGTVLSANDNFCNATGFSEAEIIGTHHRTFVPNHIQESVEYQTFWSQLASGEVLSGKFERITKDRQPLWLQATYNPIFDGEGNVYKVVKFASDITDIELEAQMVKRVLDSSRHVMERVADGDLTQQVTGTFSGDCEVLQNAINSSITTLRDSMSQIVESTRNIDMSAQTVRQGNMSLSQRTENQAASLEETAASMEEMTSTIQSNAENLQQADSLAQEARSKADAGGEVVSDAIKAMEEINESSKQISDIISVIDEIAFQTNLLALNAAVEAARAGEQGEVSPSLPPRCETWHNAVPPPPRRSRR